jgi:hypothetical protein
VPLGWGLLEVAGDALIQEKCVPTRFSGIEISRWLERIAKAATLQNAKIITDGRCHGVVRLPDTQQPDK